MRIDVDHMFACIFTERKKKQKDKMEQICRICAIKSDNLEGIFLEREQLDEEPPLADMLNECASCDITINDPLPQNICLACIQAAQDAFRFKRKCEQNHQYFWQMLEEKELQTTCEKDWLPPDIIEVGSIKVEQLEDDEVGVVNEACIEDIATSPKKSDICEKPRSSRKSKRTSYRENSEESDTDTNTNSRPKPVEYKNIRKGFFKCYRCAEKFDKRIELKLHLVQHRKVYPCPHCSKTFSLRKILKEHIRIHSDTTKFMCPMCEKSFAKEGNFKRHMYNHYRLPDVCENSLQETPTAAKSFEDLDTHESESLPISQSDPLSDEASVES